MKKIDHIAKKHYLVIDILSCLDKESEDFLILLRIFAILCSSLERDMTDLSHGQYSPQTSHIIFQFSQKKLQQEAKSIMK